MLSAAWNNYFPNTFLMAHFRLESAQHNPFPEKKVSQQRNDAQTGPKILEINEIMRALVIKRKEFYEIWLGSY